jgi:hypothetical protein
MKAISVRSFSGSVPRRAEHLVPEGQARFALDCLLEDGTLDSWRAPRPVQVLTAGFENAYQAFDCCWLYSSCGGTSWAEGGVEQNHVFATQYNDVPYPVRIVPDAMCEPVVYRLGLPCPAERIEAAPAAQVPGKGAAARQYLYRWRDSFGNESNGSEVSASLVVADGTAVQLSGWALPPAAENWDIQEIVIYRSVSGYEPATRVTENKIDAAWMQVAVIPASSVSYVDTKSDADLYMAMQDDIIEPPPAGLQGLVWLKSMNVLAGFVGRDVYFSKNNQYHNWPFHITLDDTPKAITEANGFIYVATDGHPYVLVGESDCEHAGCRQAVRMPEPLPMVGCCSDMVAIPSGAVYPSHDGLVLMTGKKAPDFITAAHYAPSDWQALEPHTARVIYYLGRLFVFARSGAFALAIKDGASTAGDTEHHTSLSLRPDDGFVTRTGRFYLRFGQEIREWNRGAYKMPHQYVSGDYVSGVPIGMGAAQVIMDPGDETFTVTVDGDVAAADQYHMSDTVSLPQWAVGQVWSWALQGTARVKIVSIAPSTKEL